MELLAVMYLGIVLLTGIVMFIILTLKKKFGQPLVEVEATLVDVDKESLPIFRGNKKVGVLRFFDVSSYSPVYEYEYNGEVYTAVCEKRMSTFKGRFKIGEKTIILLKEDNPSYIANIKQTRKEQCLDLLCNLPLLFCVLFQALIIISVFAIIIKGII